MLCAAAYPQGNTKDTAIISTNDISFIDTTIDYDELFRDFDAFMDSILSPRSFLLISASVTKGYYNFLNKTNLSIYKNHSNQAKASGTKERVKMYSSLQPTQSTNSKTSNQK